jgi:hypothetical protein
MYDMMNEGSGEMFTVFDHSMLPSGFIVVQEAGRGGREIGSSGRGRMIMGDKLDKNG